MFFLGTNTGKQSFSCLRRAKFSQQHRTESVTRKSALLVFPRVQSIKPNNQTELRQITK